MYTNKAIAEQVGQDCAKADKAAYARALRDVAKEFDGLVAEHLSEGSTAEAASCRNGLEVVLGLMERHGVPVQPSEDEGLIPLWVGGAIRA